MSTTSIKKIVILGGGTAGWMTAAALAKRFTNTDIKITLIESELIGTVGVGESTIPHIRDFNEFLGIDENVFIAETKATFKLGIAFKNWGALGADYIHPFGALGHDINGVEFHHYWLRMRNEGSDIPIDNYSLAAVAARAGKYQDPASCNHEYTYAFHFDAALYAKYLRNYAEARGVIRIEGVMGEAKLCAETGFIKSIVLQSGDIVEGELFIDCTGFRGVLIDKVMHAKFEPWDNWLLCDKAIALPCESSSQIFKPFTRAIAHKAGWQWGIPLQHRTGNGHVYCSQFMSEDEATDILLKNLDGKPLAEPKSFSFTAGKRKNNWEKNCVAIGLASGFLEPLESTSIYLIQVGIQTLMNCFPSKDSFDVNRIEFNRQVDSEYTIIRDFIIMHYKETSRDDSEFWSTCKNMSVPEDLQKRQLLFQKIGRLDPEQYGVYASVCIGQGLIPERYDFKIDKFSSDEIRQYLDKIRMEMNEVVADMPFAQDYIQRIVNSTMNHSDVEAK